MDSTQEKLNLLLKILTAFPSEALLASFPSMEETVQRLEKNEQEGFEILLRDYPAFKAAITPFLPAYFQSKYCNGNCSEQKEQMEVRNENTGPFPFCIQPSVSSEKTGNESCSTSRSETKLPDVSKISSEISQSLGSLRKRADLSKQKSEGIKISKAKDELKNILLRLNKEANASEDRLEFTVTLSQDPTTQQHVTEPLLEIAENNGLKTRKELLVSGQVRYTFSLP